MKQLKYVFIGLVSLIIVLVLIGFLLPSKQQLKETIVIDAPAGMVFDEVNDFRQWKNWSPWQDKDPHAIISYDGPDYGVGAKMAWHSDRLRVGKGSQEIIVSHPNKHLKTVLRMVGWDTVNYGVWDFEELDSNKTKVIWEFQGQVGSNILHKYMMMIFKPALRKDYRTGLQRLKAHVEQQR